MFCMKCGKKIENDSKFCTFCENKIDNDVSISKDSIKDKEKAISIVGFVFSLIMPIIGLILSIISVKKCNKYKEKTGTISKYQSLSIAGLIISILMTIVILIILGVVVIIFFIVTNGSSKLNGKWNCSYSMYDNYVVDAQFKEDKTFIWKKHNDYSNDNYLDGTYLINYREYKNGIYIYKFNLNIDHQIVNGKDYGKKSTYVRAKIYEDKAIIYAEKTGKIYHCKKAE